MAKKPAPVSIDELITVRDFIRYAVSRFNEAGLFYGHGMFNAVEEAVFMVMEKLNLPFGELDPWYDARLTKSERKSVLNLIHARVTTRKPAAYLLKKTYLQGIPFYVDERVIVPRSYIAELMVNGLSGVEDFPLIDNPDEVTSVLDLCTGSGCLAILAAHVFPNAEVDAVELSPGAFEVAKKNVAESEVGDRVHLYKGDLFKPVKGKKYDLIITNPPYVEPALMKGLPKEYAHEPKMALAGGGHDGLDIVRRILAEAPAHLHDGAGILCEIGEGQVNIISAFPDLPFLWLDTEHSSGEVFWLAKEDLTSQKVKPFVKKRK